MSKFKGVMIAVVAIMALSMVAFAQTGEDVVAPSPTPLASWQPPTEGSPVVNYHLELWTSTPGEGYTLLELVWSGATPETSLQIPEGIMVLNTTYRARVNGEDAQGRVGPWSIPSHAYTYDLGEPGVPGEIIWSF